MARYSTYKTKAVGLNLPENIYNVIKNDCGTIPVATYITNLLCMYADECGKTKI